MKVLKLNEDALAWIGVFKSFNTFLVFTNCIVPIGVSLTFVYKNPLNTNLTDFVFVALQMIAVLGNFGAFLSLGANVKEIKTLHHKLQQIVNEGTKIFSSFFLNVVSFTDSWFATS